MYSIKQPITTLSDALYQACQKDLQSVNHKAKNPNIPDNFNTERRPIEEECSVYHFPQTWNSTALGFAGIGGQTVTTAYTTVVIVDENACVYFNGHLAYCIKKINSVFWEDLEKHAMKKCSEAEQYN